MLAVPVDRFVGSVRLGSLRWRSADVTVDVDVALFAAAATLYVVLYVYPLPFAASRLLPFLSLSVGSFLAWFAVDPSVVLLLLLWLWLVGARDGCV